MISSDDLIEGVTLSFTREGKTTIGKVEVVRGIPIPKAYFYPLNKGTRWRIGDLSLYTKVENTIEGYEIF